MSTIEDRAIEAKAVESLRARFRGALLRPREEGYEEARHGAPSAGSPPYDPYEMTPVTGFGLGMDEPIRGHALEILDGVLPGDEP